MNQIAKNVVDQATGNSEKLRQAEAYFGVPFNNGITCWKISWDDPNIVQRLLDVLKHESKPQ